MVSTQASISRIEENALVSQAHASTYCIVDLSEGATGTVVAVKIASRYFLATAAHVIPSSHQFEIVLRDALGGVRDFAALHVHQSLDIGLLEILPKDVPRFRDTFVPGNRLGLHADQQKEYNVTVTGYPGMLSMNLGQRPLSPTETVEVSLRNAFTLHSVALPLNEWPSLDQRPVPGADVFISFDPDDDTMHQLHGKTTGIEPTKVEVQAPHPGGMSGCGIWQLNSAMAGAVWQPAAALHAIQASFVSADLEFWQKNRGREANPKSWLHAILIDKWLDIVNENYPNLRSDVAMIRQGQVQPTAVAYP